MKQFFFLFGLLTVASAIPHHIIYQPAPLNPDGTVADTPEVAAVKSAHLSELAKAGGAVPHPSLNWARSWGVQSWLPYSSAPLNADGTVAETPEVQHAKGIHLAAHAQARANLGLPVDDTPEVALAKAAHFAAHHAALSRGKRWAPAPLNPDGTVADTPEVAAAKAYHLSEIARARGYALPAVIGIERRWWGPLAPLNPDGTVAETPEVRAAKAAHLAAHANARIPLHAIWAPLNLGQSVVETPEVIARKIEHFAAHGEALARLG